MSNPTIFQNYMLKYLITNKISNRGISSVKKIFHLRSSSFIGGPEKQIIRLLSASRKYKHVVGSFVVNAESNELINYAKKFDLETVTLKVNSSFDPRCVFQLYQYVKRQKVDVVCTHDYRANFICNIIRCLLPVKQIAFFRGWTGENTKITIYEKLDSLILKRLDGVVAVASHKVEEMVRIGVNEEMISIIPNSIEVEDLNGISYQDIRGKYNISRRKRVVGTVGRLSVEKGHRFFMEAIPLILKEHSDIVFIIVGEGVEAQALFRLSEQWSIEDKVIFTGWQEDPLSFIKCMDIFVLPSLTEGLPNVLLEAAALEVPIVSTSVGGCGDIVINGKTGVLVEPRNPSSISAAVSNLLSNPTLAAGFAEAGRKHIEKEFNVASSVTKYEKLVDSLCW